MQRNDTMANQVADMPIVNYMNDGESEGTFSTSSSVPLANHQRTSKVKISTPPSHRRGNTSGSAPHNNALSSPPPLPPKTSIFHRLVRKMSISDSIKADLSTLNAAPSVSQESADSKAGVGRRMSLRQAPRKEAEEDQKYRSGWREREAVAGGFFDARQKVQPDVSHIASKSLPTNIYTVHPSTLSTFAPRAPLKTSSAPPPGIIVTDSSPARTQSGRSMQKSNLKPPME